MNPISRSGRAALAGGIAAVTLALAACGGGDTSTASAQSEGSFGQSSARITNPYLPISKFHRCVLRGRDGDQRLRVVRVLLDRTKHFPLGGRTVTTAVVRDSVTDLRSGKLIEKTIDYFAQDRAGGVHYFGEDVNEYEHGKPTGHSGQWRVGRDVKRPGLLMPAHPKVGDTFFSEKVPGVAVEHDRVVASGLTKRVHGRTYRGAIRIREHATTPRPAEFELKTYAPGIGVITEANGGLGLVRCS
jgi:hypothetical protein